MDANARKMKLVLRPAENALKNIPEQFDVKREVEIDPCRHKAKGLFSSLKFGGGTTLMSVDFADDIDRYMRYLEDRHQLEADFLSTVGRIDGRMRQILVDWLVHIQVRFQLDIETLSLTVKILDHSLCLLPNINKQNLQLLGVSCMFVAAKFEEIFVPELEDFEKMAANAFTKRDVLQMEQKVLRALNFDLSFPHAITFMRRYRFFISPTDEVWVMAKFVSEVAMVCYQLAHHPSSVVAAVSLYLASLAFECPLNSPQLFSVVFRMHESEVVSTARSFVDYVTQFLDPASKLFALRNKYQDSLVLTEDKLIRLREFGDNLI